MAEGLRGRRSVRWVVLGAILVIALVIGSGVLSSSTKSEAQRITAIETKVKCPSCQDLSVAESTSPSSLAIRHQIAAEVHAGRSDAEIIASLQARYGATVELTPTGSLSIILWLVPVILVVAIAVTLVIWRRRKQVTQ